MRIIYDIHKSFESSLSVRLNLREVSMNFINESKHQQIFYRGVLSYSDIYIGKGSLWFRLFFILLSFLLCSATKSRAAY